ncbi:hypothetical protein GH714_027707 [Hevea brasiliensis]|uniref:Uncharacterized protein n=1 Tax=Hevea brasiliensis TaxID=3981 RepID=A0A6A6KUP7_HEVBR|nr:hypothetical protein GH714_027707 [Hevea brasiliensis]
MATLRLITIADSPSRYRWSNCFSMYLFQIFLKFVDTEQFQRLRDLKQLGLVDMVYPGAVHSRFEHSLGVYWLASEAVHRIKAHQGLELGIDGLDIQTVKLAGLLHDVGHGPFSHLFEHEFLPRVLNGFKWSHEDMSMRMIDYIVDTHYIEIDPECQKKAKEMIIASTEHSAPRTTNDKQFLYDIVANGRNGIDVDKLVGLITLFETPGLVDWGVVFNLRDLTVHKLFATRADMHRTVYTHAKVKAIELMVVDALTRANGYLQITDKIDNPDDFWKIDDSILKHIETSSSEELKEARDLVQRIRRRELYQFCNEFSVPKDQLEHFKDITPQDIVCSQARTGPAVPVLGQNWTSSSGLMGWRPGPNQKKTGHITLKEEDVAVSIAKIDLTRGRNNPLESVKFFKDYESEDKFSIPDHLISHLLPSFYQDKIVRVYAKKAELVEAVSEAFVNFQLKEYGMKAQVHATPEKKRQRNLFSSRTRKY